MTNEHEVPDRVQASTGPERPGLAQAGKDLPDASVRQREGIPARDFRVSVAPMMDWTDRHCRSFHRLLSRHAWLYTEMVTAQAIAHGDLEHLLGRGEEGGRVVLQLGGNDPALLAAAARQGEAFGYDEINLNCGCPSDRVREGAFGACLMAEPQRVAECVAAMQAAVRVPVTVKHRIGIDRREDYGFVQRFVAEVRQAGCRRFIVHARNAWLDGLDPKANREIPPLRYAVVHQLQAEFGDCAFELNGGLQDLASGWQAALGADGAPALHGLMYGRRAYHDPWLLAGVDAMLAACAEADAQGQNGLPALAGVRAGSRTVPGGAAVAAVAGEAALPGVAREAGEAAGQMLSPLSRRAVVGALVAYLERGAARGVSLRHLARHVLGLYHGQPAARLWRRQLSDPAALARNDPRWLLTVCEQVEAEAGRLRSVTVA